MKEAGELVGAVVGGLIGGLIAVAALLLVKVGKWWLPLAWKGVKLLCQLGKGSGVVQGLWQKAGQAFAHRFKRRLRRPIPAVFQTEPYQGAKLGRMKKFEW